MKKKTGEIVSLNYLRLNRDAEKDCKCFDAIFELDPTNRRVRCAECGAILEAFDALLKLSEQNETLNKLQQRRMDQKEQLDQDNRILRDQKLELEKEILELQREFSNIYKAVRTKGAKQV